MLRESQRDSRSESPTSKTARREPRPPDHADRKVESPVSAAESLDHFRLPPGLRLELVAAEPDVIDPVAIAFDEDGRLWVVEMNDYPNGPQAGEPPKSRIRLLEDRDGDGRFETARVFADKLLFATGVQPWRGGVIVTLAGEIAYFKDTDGDGRADVRESWFRGFAEQNPQLRANHPRFGLDNHIYVANGLRGGTVTAVPEKWGDGKKPVSISGMDFRFDPLGGRYEAVSGMGQFGLTFDDFGNRFVCSNRNPCRHIVLEDRYIKRNPFLAVREVAHDVSPAGEASRVFPLTAAWTTSNLHAGQFTAACGVTIYRGRALPAEYLGNSFTCEPTGNLVHRDVLKTHGPTFTVGDPPPKWRPGGERPEREEVEFLASRDEWFRPVNLANGPDGALYVVDMYRAVIEHPQFMPEELKNRPDLNLGNDRGRIYRVVFDYSRDRWRRSAQLKLSKASAEELVALLQDPNAWHRETAARLLYERQDKAAVAPLRRLADRGKNPIMRIHALWALAGLDALTEETARLDDAHPRVREHAIRLAECWLDSSAAVREKVIADTADNNARLRFQAVLSLGELGSPSGEIIEALAECAVRDAGDVWMRRAVLCSVGDRPAELLSRVLKRHAWKRRDRERIVNLVGEIAEIVGSRKEPDEVAGALATLASFDPDRDDRSDPTARRIVWTGLTGLCGGLSRRGSSLAAILPEDRRDLKDKLAAIFAGAASVAADADADPALRLEAIGVLRFSDVENTGDMLLRLAKSDRSHDVRLKAIDVLGGFRDPKIAASLLDGFRANTPAVQRAILHAMLRDSRRIEALLDEIEAKRIAVGELDPTHVRALTNHRDAAIRKRAGSLLAAALPADRKEVVETYRRALKLKGDPVRGRAVFDKNCSTCHRIGGIGVNVAPDISDSRTKTFAALLDDILQPNRAIDNNYLSYTVVTVDGKLHTGIVAAETASSVTLRQAENKSVTVLRQDVEELRSNGISLMPEGLEKNITVEQMADLIAFIKNWRYLDGRVPVGEARE